MSLRFGTLPCLHSNTSSQSHGPRDSDLDEGGWEETAADASSFSSDTGNSSDTGSTTVEEGEDAGLEDLEQEGEVRGQGAIPHFEDPFKLIHSAFSSTSLSSSGLNKGEEQRKYCYSTIDRLVNRHLVCSQLV